MFEKKKNFQNLRSKIRVCRKKHDLQCDDCGGSYCDRKKDVAGFRVLNGVVSNGTWFVYVR
jgi:hypothetical protein